MSRDGWCSARSAIQAKAQPSLRTDRLGRPVSRSGDAFAYNPRGEVTNAAIGFSSYRYAYDGIGNRETAFEAGTTTAYSANNVNQYTAVGSASPSYDADGNLVDDGSRTFEWSAAGHLAAAATSSRKYENTYDWRGRRVRRTEYRRVGNNWRRVEDREYVYDDWNLVYEHREHQSEGEAELSYYWGPDLSGTLQGAGGVGGLVAVSVDGDYYFPGYDNNGNVIGYWNEDGEIVAEYAYDAFGNTIYEDGSMADFFPHRFSTKYYDAETDLYYYGYRYYSPSLGRWISRDPIEEEGGNNLFLFCNNTISSIDCLGKRVVVVSASSYQPDPKEAQIELKNRIRIIEGCIYSAGLYQQLQTLSDSDFQKLVDCHHVFFNGKEFAGEREEYMNLVNHEAQSRYYVYKSADGVHPETVSEFSRLVAEQTYDISYPHDRLCIVAHGVFGTNNIRFGSDFHEESRGSFECEINQRIHHGFQGKVIYVSCFRTYGEPPNTIPLTESYRIEAPLPIFRKETRGNRPPKISFWSLRVFHAYGSGNLELE